LFCLFTGCIPKDHHAHVLEGHGGEGGLGGLELNIGYTCW